MDIIEKAVQAFVMYLGSGTTETDQVYNGKGNIDKEGKYIEVEGTIAREEPMGTGNFFIDMEVSMRSISEPDTSESPDAALPEDADLESKRAASNALTDSVLALLEIDNDNLMDALNSQPGLEFTVMGFGEMKELERGTEDNSWTSKWRRQIYCGGFASS